MKYASEKQKLFWTSLASVYRGTLISIFLLKNPTATCVAVGSFIAAFRLNKTPG